MLRMLPKPRQGAHHESRSRRMQRAANLLPSIRDILGFATPAASWTAALLKYPVETKIPLAVLAKAPLNPLISMLLTVCLHLLTCAWMCVPEKNGSSAP